MIRGCGGGCVSATSSVCSHPFLVLTFELESHFELFEDQRPFVI
jgi:hypothetical protein